MKTIKITQGYKVLISNQDYERINKFPWFVYKHHGTSYAVRELQNPRRLIKMHREILKLTDPTIQVDHIDGDGLNNQRNNLRLASPIEQRYNSKLRKDNPHGIAGVYYRKDTKRWTALLSNRSLGCFATKEEAIARRLLEEKRSGYIFRPKNPKIVNCVFPSRLVLESQAKGVS